jgi:hypothetical protein
MSSLDEFTPPPKERYAVFNDNVTTLIQPGAFEDQLGIPLSKVPDIWRETH